MLLACWINAWLLVPRAGLGKGLPGLRTGAAGILTKLTQAIIDEDAAACLF